MNGLDIKDPLVRDIAIEGKKDENYQEMIDNIQRGLGREELDKNSELLQLEGTLQTLYVVPKKTGAVIVKDGNEVLIPASQRPQMMT